MTTLRRTIITGVLMVGLALITAVADARADDAAVAISSPKTRTLKALGQVDLSKIARVGAAGTSLTTTAIEQSPGLRARIAAALNRRIPLASRASAALADARRQAALLAVPKATSVAFAGPHAPVLFAFDGLNALDSAIGLGLDVNAPTFGFSSEPPDQGLCVGNGEIVELTNLELAVYDATGNRTLGPLTLNGVFGVPSSDFLSDPKCYYDPPTNTFYMTLTDLHDVTALTHSSLLIAVMPAGSTTVTDYSIDTTDDGTNGITDAGCPCFGDQPLLGADQNGIYVTANEFALAVFNDPTSTVFNGAQIYFISKSDLAASVASPRVFSINGGLPLVSDIAASLQPSTSPDGVGSSANGGTEFFMAALDFAGTGDNRIAVWAMTNTCTFATPSCGGLPGFTPTPPLLITHPYAVPLFAVQKPGPIPLGDMSGEPLELLNTDDDRMQQLVFAHGQLYTALNTLVLVGGAFQAGIEYFMVKPSFHTRSGNLIFSVRLARSGYIAHTANDLYYPSIGVTTAGKAVMVFTISGAGMFPSAAWVPIANAGLRQIHIAAAGAGPYDGVSGYDGGGVARWGDYSAAFADGNNIWMATEYVSSVCGDSEYATDLLCGMTRAPDSNWGTSISKFVTH
jgi:hypothetical protein